MNKLGTFNLMLPYQELGHIFSDFNLVLYYRGSHSENPSYNLVTIVENNLCLILKKVMVKKLSYIVVEAIQNIERYSATGDFSEDFSAVFSDKKMFHVITQNLIENEKISSLKERLDTVNSKHSEELNEFYIECLKSDEFTSKGAGLGLIDIARKSKNTLSYEFRQLSESHSAYRLHIKIPILEDLTEETNEQKNIALVTLLNSSFEKNKSTLFYSGDFSNAFLHELLDMIKNSKKSEKLSGNSQFHHLLIELTQNIKRHGLFINDQLKGYLCIEWKNDAIELSSYNLITPEKEGILKERIDFYNRSSDEELKALSQKNLLDFTVTGGLGLIDIAILTRPNKIFFDIVKNTKLGLYFYVKTRVNHD